MSLNILIIDDSSIVRKVLMKTLGLTGVQIGSIYEAENGLVALEIIKNNWVDLVFLDINMPIMNGMEFMTHLRESRDYDDIPIIVISTEGSKERKDELLNKKIKAYLRKPITPEELANKITEVIGVPRK